MGPWVVSAQANLWVGIELTGLTPKVMADPLVMLAPLTEAPPEVSTTAQTTLDTQPITLNRSLPACTAVVIPVTRIQGNLPSRSCPPHFDAHHHVTLCGH